MATSEYLGYSFATARRVVEAQSNAGREPIIFKVYPVSPRSGRVVFSITFDDGDESMTGRTLVKFSGSHLDELTPEIQTRATLFDYVIGPRGVELYLVLSAEVEENGDL